MALNKLRIVDPVLTNVVRGYSNNTFIADAHFPVVLTDKEGFKIPQFGKDSFKIVDTQRAIGAASNRGQIDDPTAISVVLTEHDFELPVDYRESTEAMFNVERQRAWTATEVVQLKREKMAADILQTAANFPTGNKVKLTSTDQFTHADSKPFDVIETGIEAIRGKIGKKPNVMTIGAKAWSVLKYHPEILDKIKYSMKGTVTLDLFKSMFDNFTDIRIGEAIYANADGTFADVWGDNIVLSYVAPAVGGIDRDMYTPSMGYTFRKRGFPYSDTYDLPGGKVKIVRSTDLYDVKMLGSEAAYLIEDTNA